MGLENVSLERWLTIADDIGANSLPYMLKAEGISDDLTKERPQWILSAYGPGRGAPIQLFGGMPREQSFEEIRLLHYKAVAEGNPQRAVRILQFCGRACAISHADGVSGTRSGSSHCSVRATDAAGNSQY